MAVSHYRAPGIRWPIPNLLTCLAVLGFVTCGWVVFAALEEERRMEALFHTQAAHSDRVQSAEMWAEQGSAGLPRLREALASSDASTRCWGLLALAYMSPQEAKLALPEVLRLCEDPDPNVQLDAMILVAELTDEPHEIAHLIASRLVSPHRRLVWGAQKALYELGPHAVPAIAAVLPDAEPNIQANCLHMLTRCAFDDRYGPQARAVISDYLKSPNLHVRQNAYEVASLIRPLTGPEVSRGLRDSDSRIVKLALKEWTVNPDRDAAEWPQLLRLLGDRPELRRPVLKAIASHGPSAADGFAVILSEMNSEDPAIRALALAALVRTDGDAGRARPVLLRSILDSNTQVARQAARLLAEVAPQELPEIVSRVLMPRLDSQEESLQLAAVAALSEMPMAAAKQRLALIRLLSVDSSEAAVSPAVQIGLAEVLGNMGPEARDAVPALLSLIQRMPANDPRISIPVAALGEIGQGEPAALRSLIDLYEFGTARSSVTPALIEALARLGRDQAEVIDLVLVNALQSKSPPIKVAALRAIPHLAVDSETAQATYTHALMDPNVNVRIAACLLLAELGGSEDDVLNMARLLKDDKCLARVVAARSLAGLGPAARSAVPALLAASQDDSNRFSYAIADRESDEEGEQIAWNLFDGQIRALDRSPVNTAVQSALAEIDDRDRAVPTSREEQDHQFCGD